MTKMHCEDMNWTKMAQDREVVAVARNVITNTIFM